LFLAEIPREIENVSLPAGAGGTRATLRIMSRLVKETRADPTIRNTAKNLVMTCAPGDYRAEVETCFHFVRDHIRYLQDTNGVERVSNPVVVLADQAGDCDDKACCLSALLESIGHPCRFVAVGYTLPGEYEHVYVETRIGSSWVACETTLNVELGWAPVPPNVDEPVVCKMIEHI